MADVLAYLVQLGNVLCIDQVAAAQANLERNRPLRHRQVDAVVDRDLLGKGRAGHARQRGNGDECLGQEGAV
jgi:hypothetical protein